jgi:hypothetical protein
MIQPLPDSTFQRVSRTSHPICLPRNGVNFTVRQTLSVSNSVFGADCQSRTTANNRCRPELAVAFVA